MIRKHISLQYIAQGAFLAAASIACLVLSSCAFGDKEDVVPTVSGEERAVYVAGRYNDHACLWIVDGSMPARFMLAETPGTDSSLAQKVIVDNGVIYVSGSCYISGVRYPMQWIDGVPTMFAAANVLFAYNSLAVHNGHVFVPGQSGMNACLMVDGKPTILPLANGMVTAFATSVAVNDTHIVVGGYQQDGGMTNFACQWIDGTPMILDSQSYVFAVKMENGLVYAAGSWNIVPVMWIDGARTILDPSTAGEVNDMVIRNGIPYMVGTGSGSDRGFLYIGGVTRQTLCANPGYASARGLEIFDDAMTGRNILFVGMLYNGSQMSAILSVNGSIVALDNYGAFGTNLTEAWSVTLGPRLWR